MNSVPGRRPPLPGPDPGGGGGLARPAAHHGEHVCSDGDGGPRRIRELCDVLVVLVQGAAFRQGGDSIAFNIFEPIVFRPFMRLFRVHLRASFSNIIQEPKSDVSLASQ